MADIIKNEFAEIDPFIEKNFFYEKSMKNSYKILCPKCKEFFRSFMSGDSEKPIELFEFLKNSVKQKKDKGTILVINCPKCNNVDAINFVGKLNVDE